MTTFPDLTPEAWDGNVHRLFLFRPEPYWGVWGDYYATARSVTSDRCCTVLACDP